MFRHPSFSGTLGSVAAEVQTNPEPSVICRHDHEHWLRITRYQCSPPDYGSQQQSCLDTSSDIYNDANLHDGPQPPDK